MSEDRITNVNDGEIILLKTPLEKILKKILNLLGHKNFIIDKYSPKGAKELLLACLCSGSLCDRHYQIIFDSKNTLCKYSWLTYKGIRLESIDSEIGKGDRKHAIILWNFDKMSNYERSMALCSSVDVAP